METNEYFKQNTIKLNDSNFNGYIDSDELLSLLKDDELKQAVSEKYDLSTNTRVVLDNIDFIFKIIKKYTEKFSLIRLNVSFDNVTAKFYSSDEVKEGVYFEIDSGYDSLGEVYENLKTYAKYDSVSMFFDKRKLTQYINYLKKNDSEGFLLNELNNSWRKYYESDARKIDKKVFRILDDGEDMYLKSINTERYKEYGIAETFVLTCLELSKISKTESAPKFTISSLALSESKIDIIVSLDEKKYIKDLGQIYSSISIRNEDQGNKSIGFYSSLEFKLEKMIDGKVFLFPNKKIDGINHSSTINHTAGFGDFIDSHEAIGDSFNNYNSFKDDYFFFKDTVDHDELRAKIEEKVTSIKSPFKGMTQLVDLFKKEKVGHITNLAALLKLCGLAEMLEMDFDLKFKLRYLISNVLLYGKNDLE